MEIPRFDASQITAAFFIQAIEHAGVLIVDNLLAPSFCDDLCVELAEAIEKEAAFHGTKNHKDYGMLLACPIYGGKFLDVIDNPKVMQPFEWMLGNQCIVYVYTSSSMPPNQTNHASRIHVDRPHFIPGYTEALGTILLLSDFTEENGATWVLPGSHHTKEPPSEADFYAHAKRIIAPKGSAFYFHLRLWHAGGKNHSNQWRHALGIGMVRGYLKQRIDLPRALQHYQTDLSKVSQLGLQKLGFFAQPPTNLNEFYAPPELRTYRQTSEWEVPPKERWHE